MTILLSAPTQSIDMSMTATVTNPLEFYTAWIDVTPTSYLPDGFQGSGSSGPFTFFSAPPSGHQYQIKYLSVYNNDSVANTFSFSQNTSGTRRKLITCTLQVGEALVYCDGVWTVYSATGRALSTAGDVVGPSSATDNAIARFDATTGKLIQNSSVTVDDSGNIVLPASSTVDGLDPSTISIENSHAHGFIKSMLPPIAPALTTSGTAYFVYLGQVKTAITPLFVSIPVTTAGAGGQTAECGFFSTPLAPSGAGQNLTKLVASGSVDALTGTGRKGNSSTFATSVPAGTHLWVGARIVMVTTQPQVFGLTGDYGSGAVLTLAGSGVLTGAGPFAGSIPAFATTLTWLVPDLRMIL